MQPPAAGPGTSAAVELPPPTEGGDAEHDARFTTPMAVTSIDVDQYQGQLQDKLRRLRALFSDLTPAGVDIEVFESPPSHYRMRAEFSVFHNRQPQQQHDGSSAQEAQPPQHPGEVHYVMFDSASGRKPPPRVRVDSFPVASRLANELMAVVMRKANAVPVLREKLFQVNFHTGLSGDSMVTLLYHRKLGPEWVEAAQRLRDALQAGAPSAGGTRPQVIGRSRKQKLELERGYILERLRVNGREYVQKQVEGSFSQPNGTVCQHMLSWAQDVTRGSGDSDLLELYCGNGNFTVPLAQNFRQVVATEVAKASVDAARFNLEANGVTNVFLARMASEEFAETMRARGTRRRLAGLAPWDELRLDTILVDPPRAGLDDYTVKLLSEFENVVYISCNPETLHANLTALQGSHVIERFAAFDQFPYTHHIECGVYLRRRR